MSTPGSHLTLDELADALAGARDGDTHLQGCAACGDRLAELEAAEASVRAQLAALPDPPLPAGLAERLTAALAAEPAPAHPSTTASATVTPLAPRRARPWVPAAAAAAVLVLGGGLGLALLTDRSGSGSTSLADGGAAGGGAGSVADTAGPVTVDTDVDYGDDVALAAALPEVLAGTAGEQSRSTADAPAPAAESAPDAATTQQDAGATGLTAAGDGDGLARLRDPAALASCLAALLPPDEPDVRPLALDYATYQGAPALAVVLPDPDPAKLSVFVVGPGCSQEDDGTLRFVRVDRP